MGLDRLSMWLDDVGCNSLAAIVAEVYRALPDDGAMLWTSAGVGLALLVAGLVMEARGRRRV